VRVRGDERNGAERRSENLFGAGAACAASGDSGIVLMGLVGFCDLGVRVRVIPKGDRGERGVSEARNEKRDCFDGERESERRMSCREEKCEASSR
jgi:hypothetical protein